MPLIIPANTLSGGYEVANSCRFNQPSGDYLNRTPSSAGNQKTFTMSCWYKKMKTGAKDIIMSTTDGGGTFFVMGFVGSGTHADKFYIYFWDGSTDYGYTTNRLFRDYSAWLNIVVSIDTTQGTEGDRVKLYINGTEESLTATYGAFPQNHDTYFNDSNVHYIGYDHDAAGALFNGYLAELVVLDGTAANATSFGEFDEDSPTIWKPINVSGLTFGTNGFYLDFEDSSSLGNDKAGSNNFTVNNLTALDQSTDTPTNNFCTLNPLTISGATLSEGNLKYTHTQNGEYRTVLGTFGLNSGKWYWEVKIVSEDGYRPVSGIASTQDTPYYQPAYSSLHLGKGNASAGLFTHGDMQLNGSSGTAPDTLDNNDITGFALDLDSGTNTLAVYKNGSLDETYNLTTVGTYGSYTPAITGYHSANNVMEINFGNPSFTISSGNSDANGYGNFEYSVPSGFYSLCTKNLAEYG
jgi:hypothetical protein